MPKKEYAFRLENISRVGAYSSFFGFLLITSLLAFKSTFSYALDLIYKNNSSMNILIPLLVIGAILFIIFVVVPSIPILGDVRAYQAQKNWRMFWAMVFLIAIYDLTIVLQLWNIISSYQL